MYLAWGGDFMHKFQASLAAQALAGALSIVLSATPAAAVTVTGECANCLAAALGSSAGGSAAQKVIDPNCIKGCGAVPEPMSWALLILGFGLVGANLRARRRLDVA